MKLVIERERWFRGQGAAISCLLNEHGQMCCLGFFGVACGYGADAILDLADPENVVRGRLNLWPDWALVERDERDLDDEYIGRRAFNAPDIHDLIVANDDAMLPEPERESRIAEIFAKHGVEVEFR